MNHSPANAEFLESEKRYSEVECPACDGERTFICRTCRGNGSPGYDIHVCWACGGSGIEKCEKCEGTGVIYEQREARS